MSSQNQKDKAISQAAATRLKMQLALAQIPLQRNQSHALEEWLDSVPLLSGDTPVQVSYGVSLTSDLKQLTWRASGSASEFIPRVVRFFDDIGVSQKERLLLAKIGQQLMPESLGYWLQARDTDLDGGWFLPKPMQLQQAFDTGLITESHQPVLEWAERHRVTDVISLERSVGESTPFTPP